MATINELLNNQPQNQTEAGTQPVATNDGGPDGPGLTPIGTDPGPDR
jgi:hypothetical protein